MASPWPMFTRFLAGGGIDMPDVLWPDWQGGAEASFSTLSTVWSAESHGFAQCQVLTTILAQLERPT